MSLSMRMLKILTILLPTGIIGGFEYVRHEYLLSLISMETGNLYMTLLTLLLSYWFANWMFRRISASNERLAEEQAKRAVYEERERLAQELHDNIAQVLFFLNVQLKKGQLDEARAAVSEMDHHLRQAIFNLRTSPENSATFTSRLSAWLNDWSGISGIAVEQRLDAGAGLIARSEEVHLFSIIREAFTNIRKHSRADHASIELGRMADSDRWSLRITDNGCGMTREEIEDGDSSHHYGMALMRKNAQELGAELSIQNNLKQGVVLLLLGPKGGEKQ